MKNKLYELSHVSRSRLQQTGWKSQSEWQRTEINGESICPWCGQPSDRGRLKNITDAAFPLLHLKRALSHLLTRQSKTIGLRSGSVTSRTRLNMTTYLILLHWCHYVTRRLAIAETRCASWNLVNYCYTTMRNISLAIGDWPYRSPKVIGIVPILHRFWDIARTGSKIADFNLPHLYLTPRLSEPIKISQKS